LLEIAPCCSPKGRSHMGILSSLKGLQRTGPWSPRGKRTEKPEVVCGAFEPTLLDPSCDKECIADRDEWPGGKGGKACLLHEPSGVNNKGASVALKRLKDTPLPMQKAISSSSSSTRTPSPKTPKRRSPRSNPRPKRHSVWLNVYDLDKVTAYLNTGLRGVNLGVHHCGVEVLGKELYYAWDDSDLTGVMQGKPRSHGVHVYKETLWMGDTEMSEVEIRKLISALCREWPGRGYHPIRRNCLTFAEEFTRRLQVPQPFPEWVMGVVTVGRESPALSQCADHTWRALRKCMAPAVEADT